MRLVVGLFALAFVAPAFAADEPERTAWRSAAA